MGIVNVNRETGDNFQDNQRYDDWSFTSASREYKPTQQRTDWRIIVATIAGLCFAFVLLAIAYGIWKTIYCWGERHYNACTRLDVIEPIIFQGVLFLIIGSVVAGVTIKLRTFANQQRAITNRTNLVLDRFGDQYPADFFNRLQASEMLQHLMERYTIANALQKQIAPHQMYKGVNSLSINNSNQLALPTAIDVLDAPLQAVASNEWLTWINEQPHVILAGATKAGKTITAKAILAARIAAGEQIGIIDPHSDQWFSLPVIGGGENWHEVKDAFESIFLEYKDRLAQRDQHLKDTGAALQSNHFKRLTVLLDEAFAASLHLSTARKGQLSPWELFSEVLGSGARKVGISIILLTQTTNVEDLGLSGPLRQNFTRIALDQRTIKFMIQQDEKDSDRRQKLYEALIGMQYPATTVMDAQVHLLDRTGLDQIREPIITPDNIWCPVRPQGTFNGPIPPLRTDGRGIIDQLRALRLSGISRDDARDVYGLVFSNDDWTAAL